MYLALLKPLIIIAVAGFVAILSAAGIYRLYKGERYLLVRGLAIFLCLPIFFSSTFLTILMGIAIIEWYRVCRSGEVHIRTVILQPENHERIVWSDKTTSSQKEQSEKILKDFAQENFKVVLYNYYYEGLEFMVHLHENRYLFIAIEVPEAYLGSVFFREGGEYRLRVIEEPINGIVSFCRYESSNDNSKVNNNDQNEKSPDD